MSPTSDDELLAGLGFHFKPKLDRIVAEPLDALHLQRLDNLGCILGILRKVSADLLDDLLRLVEIRVVSHADRQLVDDPIAAHVLNRAELAKRNDVKISPMVSELDRAEAERLDGPFELGALDVLPDPEGIVEEIEHTADDVFHQRLSPKSDRHPDDPRSRDERSDFDAEGRKYGKQDDDQERYECDITDNRKERFESLAPARVVGIRLVQFRGVGQLSIQSGLEKM